MVGAGVGEDGVDDAGGGVGDGDDDGGLFLAGLVDALDVEHGGDDLLQRAGGLGEQSRRIEADGLIEIVANWGTFRT